MKILFLTGLYPKDKEESFRQDVKNHTLQNASNEFQWRIVEGLYDNHVDFYLISMPFLPCFPMYKNIYTLNGDLKYNGSVIGRVVKYCTLPVVKELSLKYRLRFQIKSFLESNKNELVYIISYNSLGYMQKAIKPLKKKYNIRLCSIITDLIDDATNPIFKLSFFKYMQARIEQNIIWKSYDYTDGFILLSKHMVDLIPQAINRNIIIEGIAKSSDPPVIKLKNNNIRSVVYTGVLAKFAGVDHLIDAFMKTDNENFQLIICGSGELSGFIEKCSKIDSRIIYKGSVSQKEAIKLQREATAVINPRLPLVSLTRYSFPSKTMEYLLSGTPMIGYKLEGIPEEYFDYFYIPKDFSILALTETISCVLLSSPEHLMIRAKRAQDFIMSNKTSEKQVKRIVDFLINIK